MWVYPKVEALGERTLLGELAAFLKSVEGGDEGRMFLYKSSSAL